MGICQSYVQQKNKENLSILETLNKTIDNIRLLLSEEERQQHILQMKRLSILDDIEQEKTNLEMIKKKKHLTIETIKLFECKICMENLNKIMCVPCGHCFCLECSKGLEHCPICRSKIETVNNIYFN